MRPIKLHSNLLGRPARKRRLRRRILLVLGLAALIGVVYAARQRFGAAKPRQLMVSDALLAIEPPRIVVPPGLDEYLSPPEKDGADGENGEGIPRNARGQVVQGQTLFDAMRKAGVPTHSIQPVVNSVGELFDFRRSRVGDAFEAELDSEGTILRFQYQSSPEVVYEARLIAPGEYQSLRVDVPLDIERRAVAVTLKGSLYGSMSQVGEGEELARMIARVLQWDIDFSRDVRPGDAFRLIYERVNLNGRFLRYGRILAVEYRGSHVSERAYWFEAENGEGFYSAQGQPLQRMFLRAPTTYRFISSPFSMQRIHPVLGRVRPHLGVDYVADQGTPVYSVADGVVRQAGRHGASGNLVTIDHAESYRSGYAHLHAIARGITRGKRVRQGQIIGYVGNTGRSTGAHLHFSMKYRGNFIDPEQRIGARMPGLEGRELQEFLRVRDRFQLELEELLLPEINTARDGGEHRESSTERVQ